MKKRALYSLLPLAVLVGCSWFHRDSDDVKSSAVKPPGTTFKCFEKNQCRVTVVVTSCSATGITANPYTLKVARRLKDVPIVWTLRAPAGFSFAPDAINFKNKELASRQFTTSKSGSHEFVWEDANTAYGTFPYNIKVRQDGRDCPVLDPIVVNDDDAPPP